MISLSSIPAKGSVDLELLLEQECAAHIPENEVMPLHGRHTSSVRHSKGHPSLARCMVEMEFAQKMGTVMIR